MEIKFSEILSAALREKQPQFVTRLPKAILTETEQKYVAFINKCLTEGWIPSIETFKKEFRFVELQSEIPSKVMYNLFAEQRRNEYLAEQLAEYVEENKRSGKHPYTEFAQFQIKLLDSTVIPNPEVVDYSAFSRESYNNDVYKSKYYLPHFEEISSGLNGGDFVVIMAGTKGFKTTLLKSLTHAAFFIGNENVVFCSQEQSALSMAQQLDMQALEKVHSNLRKGIDSEQMNELKDYQQKINKRGNKLFITPPVRSVRQMHEYITSLNIPVKKVFIDGLNLMQGDFSDSYNSLQKVCAELKAYAIEHNMIIVAVTQSNREGYKAAMSMGAQHIAGSFAIAMYADVMLALSTIEEDGKPHVYVRPILNRHGDLDRKILMIPNYLANGRFTVDYGLLPPDYSPDDPVISLHTSKVLRSNFKAETGLSWDDVQNKLGDKNADALLGYLAETTPLSEFEETVLKTAEKDLF